MEAPVELVKVPGGHLLHSFIPEKLLYVPTGHLTQVLAPLFAEYVPGAQGKHEAVPFELAKYPASQETQEPLSKEGADPASQVMQSRVLLAPINETLPLGHSLQVEAPK